MSTSYALIVEVLDIGPDIVEDGDVTAVRKNIILVYMVQGPISRERRELLHYIQVIQQRQKM